MYILKKEKTCYKVLSFNFHFNLPKFEDGRDEIGINLKLLKKNKKKTSLQYLRLLQEIIRIKVTNINCKNETKNRYRENGKERIKL